MSKETYSQALERIYSVEGGETVGNKEQFLDSVAAGHYRGVPYNDRMKAAGVSEDEYKQAQLRDRMKGVL